MGKAMRWAVVLGLLVAGAGAAHEKRTDRCGCHHQYGLRHCHPGKKTRACEAPAKAEQKVKPRSKQAQERGQAQRVQL